MCSLSSAAAVPSWLRVEGQKTTRHQDHQQTHASIRRESSPPLLSHVFPLLLLFVIACCCYELSGAVWQLSHDSWPSTSAVILVACSMGRYSALTASAGSGFGCGERRRKSAGDTLPDALKLKAAAVAELRSSCSQLALSHPACRCKSKRCR